MRPGSHLPPGSGWTHSTVSTLRRRNPTYIGNCHHKQCCWLFYHFDGTISYNSIDLYSQIIMIIIDCYSRTSITATELSYFLLIFSYHLIMIIIIEWYSKPPLPHQHHDIFSSNHHITISSWSWWSSTGIPEPPLPQLHHHILTLYSHITIWWSSYTVSS